jgi:hypothetical protein
LAILVAGICIYGNSSEAIPVREVVARGARLTINWIRTPKIADSERIQGQLTGDWQSIFSPAEGGFEGELNAIKYIASHTRVSDPIFVGARDNSMIYVNDIRVYWLTGRLPGARYFELDAGVASIAPVQDGIIRDLEKGGVNWAILQDEKGEGDLSFLARAHPESRRLDDFFITRFFEVERFGQFSVVKRR